MAGGDEEAPVSCGLPLYNNSIIIIAAKKLIIIIASEYHRSY